MQGADIVSAYPHPPIFYKLYANYKGDGDDDAPPPPPPPPSNYKMFGLPYTTSDVLPTLEEEGREQLYPKDTTDPVPTLKKLNRSVLFNYLQLLEGLINNCTLPPPSSSSPLPPSTDQHKSKIDDIELLFVNMHHLLNGYRPHQAREFLIESMEQQIRYKKEATEEMLKLIAESRKILEVTKKQVETFTKELPQIDTSEAMNESIRETMSGDVEMHDAQPENNSQLLNSNVMPHKFERMKFLLDSIKDG